MAILPATVNSFFQGRAMRLNASIKQVAAAVIPILSFGPFVRGTLISEVSIVTDKLATDTFYTVAIALCSNEPVVAADMASGESVVKASETLSATAAVLGIRGLRNVFPVNMTVHEDKVWLGVMLDTPADALSACVGVSGAFFASNLVNL